MALMLRLEILLGQIFLAREIDGEADQHADAGGAEAVMPAINVAKRADDQRRGDHAGVDAEIEDLEGVGAAVVLGAVERADLARDIALEHARAEDEAEEGEEEGQLERHQEMPGGHSDGAEQHGAALAEHAVGEPAAEDRSEEHTSELQSLMRNSYAVFCLKKKKQDTVVLM